MLTNDNARPCDHDWTASLEAAGIEVCAWPGCKVTREAPGFDERESCAHVVMVTVEPRRAA